MTSRQGGGGDRTRARVRAARPNDANLHPPRTLAPRIARPFLETMLLEGLERQIVVVRAPAGYGKTALLSATYDLAGRHAARSGGKPATAFVHKAWISLAPRHGDVSAFAEDLLTALGAPGAAPAAGSLDAAFSSIVARNGRTVLFLDNLDSVRSDQLDAYLNALVNDAPDKLRIVCASRSRPQLSLVRLRLRGLLTEIGPAHLAFTADEMRRVLGISRLEAGVVAQSTQGWPALVGLIAEVLKSEGGADRNRTLAGWHPGVFEFVEETVLRDMPAPVRELLRRTAIVEDFSVDLASTLGNRAFDTAEIKLLGELEPVVTRSQIGQGWYRLHPVVRTYLLAVPPMPEGERRTNHASAARWFAEHDFLEQAVEHATQAGDFDFAAEAIRNAGGVDLFVQVGRLVLQRLIESLPTEVIFASPTLTLSHALILAKHGRIVEAERLVDSLNDAGHMQGKPPPPASSLDHIEGIISAYRDRNIEGLARRLERKASLLRPQAASDLAWINTLLCTFYAALGRLEDAKRAAVTATTYAETQKSSYSLIFAHIHVSLISVVAGNFSAATEAGSKAQDLIQASYWNDLDLAGISYVPLSELHYLHGEVETAERLLSEAVPRMSRGEGWVDLYCRAFATLALARMQLRGFDAAMAVLNEAENVAAERELKRLAIATDIARVSVLVRADRLESAEHLVAKLNAALRRDDVAALPMWRQLRDFAIARGRLLLAQGRAPDTLAAISHLLHQDGVDGGGYHHLLATILAVRAWWALGDLTQSLEALRTAIALSRSHGVIQPFHDEGMEMKATVRAIVRRVGLRSFSADAVHFLGRIVGNTLVRGRRPAGPAGRREPRNAAQRWEYVLTARELEILGHIVQSKSNKQIARSLGVSEVTVKFHLKNIFVKLGVSRRDMAASVARQLNLY